MMKLPDDFPLTQSQAESIFRVIVQVKQVIQCFIRGGDYKRITHLAIRAKKRRTRKKNLHRIARCVAKEVESK